MAQRIFNSTGSILRRLFWSFMAFGLTMGAVFPIYADFFVNWKPGMLPWFILGALIAGAMVGLVNYWLLKQVLLKKLSRIADVADRISQKDVSFECSIKSNDMIGEIVTSINRMTRNLREIVLQLNNNTQKLNQVSQQLIQTAEISYKNVSEQKSSTSQLRDQMQHIEQGARLVARSADQAFEAVDDVARQTSKGMERVLASQQSVNKMASQSEEVVSRLQTLVATTEEVGQILEVIREIAEQTNLLALNAAIEAAAAGEHGRGFAVVADEVRGLAHRTQQAVNQTHEIVETLQNQAKDTAALAESATQQVTTSTVLAHEAGQQLEAINADMKTLTELNHTIRNTANEQLRTVETVAQLSNTLSDSFEQINTATQALHQSGHDLAQQVKALQALIKTFRTQ